TGRLGAPDRDGFERLAHQLVIVAVGAVDPRPEGNAPAVGGKQALAPPLARVGRVAAGFSPHRAAPCPSLRPAPATPSQCSAARHTPAVPRARTPRTPRPRAIPGSGGVPRRTSRSWFRAARSTDTRCAAQRRSRPLLPGPPPAGYDSLRGARAVAAARAPSSPTARPVAANRHLEHAVVSSSTHSFSPCPKYGHRYIYFLLG